MKQRRSSGALNWADEDNTISEHLIAVSGGSFWRSVWKRIEDNNPARELPTGDGKISLQPPRDYVVEADRRNSAL